MSHCSSNFHPPNPFKITDRHRLENWKSWQKSYRWYANAVNLTQQSHDVQLTAFKSLLGPEALEIYNTFSLLDITDVESVIHKFDEHFKPKLNLIHERLKLYRLYQKSGQSFESFLEAVTTQVDKCEFGSMRDDMILYKIVGGLGNDVIRKALLDHVDLNCEKAVEICRASAASHFMLNELRSKTGQKGEVKTSRVVLKRLNNKNGQTEEITKSAKSVERVGAAKSKKTQQKSKTNSVKGLTNRKGTSSVPKPRKLPQKKPKESMGPTDKTTKTGSQPVSDDECQRPVTRKSKAVKRSVDGEIEPKTEQELSNGEKNSAEDADLEKKEFVPAEDHDVGVSSDDGGDDWRDADYRVEEDEEGDGDDAEEREAVPEAIKAEAKKLQDDDDLPGENDEQFRCEVCNEVFTSKRWLTCHRVNHAMGNGEPGEKTRKEVYPCEVCGKVLTSKSGRFVHRMNHVAGKFYSCYYCGSRTRFKQRMYLRRHIQKMHSEPKRFYCDDCGYKTHVSSNMKRHKFKHSAEKPQNCKLCDYKCIVARQMQMHIATKHTDQPSKEPVVCTQCPMKFKLPSALKVHMLSHLPPEEREKHRSEMMKDSVFTHPCDVCGKVFTSMTGLRSHRYTHTGEKPFACKECDYKAVQKSSLTVHIKLKHSRETPFICSVCGYACKLKTTLTTHMNVHTGERPYPCDQCGSRFRQHAHLITHKKTHTGEKPYVCDICGHRWAQEGNLRAHMKIHRNQSGDPSQYSPPRKRKKKPKNDPPQPAEPPAPAPSAIPPWSEQVATINPMECFPSLETPPPFHPAYPVHQGDPRPPADCRYFQQRQWPSQNPVHSQDQVHVENQVHNQAQHLISIRPVALIRTDMQHT